MDCVEEHLAAAVAQVVIDLRQQAVEPHAQELADVLEAALRKAGYDIPLSLVEAHNRLRETGAWLAWIRQARSALQHDVSQEA